MAGMPRAATTWLCRCFNEHPDTASFGETLYWGRGYVEPRGEGGRYTPEQVDAVLARLKGGECITSVIGARAGSLRNITRDTLPGVLDRMREELPERPTAGELFVGVCRAIGRAEGKSIVVEKTPHHINWLDRIMQQMPGVKIVVLLREPYSFMLSYKHQGDRKREHVRRHFALRYHPLACALVWRACMKAAEAAEARYPAQFLVVQNDDIRKNPGSVLDRVQEFYDLPTHVPGCQIAEKVKPENTSFPSQEGHDAARPELCAEDVFWMNLIGGRTMARSGYIKRSVPREPIRIAWSIARLPVWAIRNFFSLRRRVGGSIVAYLWRWVATPRRGVPVHEEANAQG